jgi:hypothetical protein
MSLKSFLKNHFNGLVILFTRNPINFKGYLHESLNNFALESLYFLDAQVCLCVVCYYEKLKQRIFHTALTHDHTSHHTNTQIHSTHHGALG